MVQEKNGVRLAAQEKGRPWKMIRAGKNSAQAITRARILPKIDEGCTARPRLPQSWRCRSGRCSVPSGGMPRKVWMRCFGTATG